MVRKLKEKKQGDAVQKNFIDELIRKYKEAASLSAEKTAVANQTIFIVDQICFTNSKRLFKGQISEKIKGLDEEIKKFEEEMNAENFTKMEFYQADTSHKAKCTFAL